MKPSFPICPRLYPTAALMFPDRLSWRPRQSGTDLFTWSRTAPPDPCFR
jgi:hypothetical protein